MLLKQNFAAINVEVILLKFNRREMYIFFVFFSMIYLTFYSFQVCQRDSGTVNILENIFVQVVIKTEWLYFHQKSSTNGILNCILFES